MCRDFFAGALGQVLSVASPTGRRVRCSRVVSRGSSYRNAENCYEHLSLKMKLITLLLPCSLNTICLSAIDASNRHVRLVLLSFCLPLFFLTAQENESDCGVFVCLVRMSCYPHQLSSKFLNCNNVIRVYDTQGIYECSWYDIN